MRTFGLRKKQSGDWALLSKSTATLEPERVRQRALGNQSTRSWLEYYFFRPNMEYAAALVKLKPGSEDKLELWRSTIASRLDEAAATLVDEDVTVESYFTIQINGETHLLWYLRAKSIQRVFEALARSKHPIDKFHYEMHEAFTAAIVMAKPLLDIPREQGA